MKTLFKICSYILLISGILSLFLTIGEFFHATSKLEIAILIISYLIPAILTLFTGLCGVMKKSYQSLITLGTLAMMVRFMNTYKGYNGIIPIYDYANLFLPFIYVILVLLINQDEIENDLQNDV
ncbi:hypothetical protein [Anaerorhabdus sp.]|uniref:hypothetical protein n=1 Tax=Anaerorhabdus sp. TaxID=1872524 RepID=UPI002FCBA678